MKMTTLQLNAVKAFVKEFGNYLVFENDCWVGTVYGDPIVVPGDHYVVIQCMKISVRIDYDGFITFTNDLTRNPAPMDKWLIEFFNLADATV